MSVRCAGCGARLDARNTCGRCRRCYNALPLALRLPPDTLFEVILDSPQAVVRAALEAHGYTVVPPGGAEV